MPVQKKKLKCFVVAARMENASYARVRLESAPYSSKAGIGER